MGWKKRTLIIIGILILLYTLAGFLVVPWAAEAILPDKLSEQLNRPVQVENISLNPYSLTLGVNGLQIQEKSGDETFVAFDEFFVNIQWVSLFKLGLIAREIRLTNPVARIARVSENEFNFSDLIPAKPDGEPSAPETEAPSEPFHFSLSNIEIINGDFEFHDAPMDKTHRLADVTFTVPMLSNFDPHIDTHAKPVLQGQLNDTNFKLDVSTKPFAQSLETTIDITLTGINLPYYFAYVPGRLGVDVTGGSLDIESKIDFKKTPANETKLEISGIVDLTDLKLLDQAEAEILTLPALHVEMAPSEPLNRHIRLADFSLTEPVLNVVRKADGTLNLSGLGPSAESDAQNDKTGDATVEPETGRARGASADEAAKTESAPFIFKLDRFNLASGTINYNDFAAPGVSAHPQAGPVQMTVDAINLSVTDFTTKENQKAQVDLSARLNSDAVLSGNGNFGVSPLALDASVKVENVQLNRAQPYFPEALKLVITDGSLNLSGAASLQSDAEAGLSAGFKGDAGIKDLALVESQAARNFLKWQSLDLNGIDVAWNPTRIALETLAINGLQQALVIRENGTLNAARVYEKEDGAAEPAAPSGETAQANKPAGSQTEAESPPLPISVGEITLRDIGISFTDYSIDPNYSAQLAFAEGSVTGLSTQAFEGAKLSLKGAVNEHAPVDISGRINPLLADMLLDVQFELQNMELSPFSAYSGKYIGNAIEKGKLNLNLNYLIENKKLEAGNKIILDQFSLGHKVESDAAVNLPVSLAIALLKDRKGMINLDLPVSGRLDDPKFSVTGVIIQSLRNLATKAATSPFALVGSIVPGGEELRYIEFEAGRAELNPASEEKLDAINKLLYERPALNLELTGFVDTENDREALKGMALDRNARAAKWTKQSKQAEEETIPFEEIELSDAEYLKYLRQVYQAEVLAGPDAPEDAKPLDDETLTVSNMEDAIRQQIEIKDAQLRLLAQDRVQAVKGYILKDERIAGKRLFIRETKTQMPSEVKKFKASRVELNLN